MRTVEVVGAVIRRDGKVYATQRGYGDNSGKWEFPGGKIEPGETPEQALVREIHEELDARVRVLRYICTARHEYPDFRLVMHCYLCEFEHGSPTLLEHSAARWVDASDIGQLDWLPADIDVIETLKQQGII